jgi:hypothetical protein
MLQAGQKQCQHTVTAAVSTSPGSANIHADDGNMMMMNIHADTIALTTWLERFHDIPSK